MCLRALSLTDPHNIKPVLENASCFGEACPERSVGNSTTKLRKAVCVWPWDVVAWGRQPCRVRRYKALRTPWALVQVYPQLEEKFFGGFEWNQSLLSRSASAPTQTLYLEDKTHPEPQRCLQDLFSPISQGAPNNALIEA